MALVRIRHTNSGPKTQPINLMLQDVHGKDVRLSDYRGKTVIIDIWATWCPYCVREIPDLVALQAEAMKTRRPLQIIGISVDTDKEAVKEFTNKHVINYPIVYADAKQMEPFGVIAGYPSKFFLNTDGIIVDTIVGMVEPPVLRERLAKLSQQRRIHMKR